VVEQRQQLEVANDKVADLTHANNQAEIRLKDTNEVLRTLEDRLRTTEVSVILSPPQPYPHSQTAPNCMRAPLSDYMP